MENNATLMSGNNLTMGATPSHKTMSPSYRNSPQLDSYKNTIDNFNSLSNAKPETKNAQSSFAFGNNLSSTTTLLPRLELPGSLQEDNFQND
jgi:hypothetical protein